MPPVTALVLAPLLPADAGPLERSLDAARSVLIERHRAGFLAVGATAVVVRREPPDDTPFGARLRRLVRELRPAGLIVLGAGAIPLATAAERRALVAVAAGMAMGEAGGDATGGAGPARAGTGLTALANQRFSADVIAIARAGEVLRDLPDLASDNALPRWLAEVAGVVVGDLGGRRRLAMDVDSPLDLLLLDGAPGAPGLPLPPEAASEPVRARLAALRALSRDPTAELLVAGRTSAADLRWLERETRSRTRVLVEERGLRTGGPGALPGRANPRPPASVIGALLDRDGPDTLGRQVSALCDGALVDSRVLMAHRMGADERAWPPAEDRYASDLLLADRVGDPWLRALTHSAATAPVPVLLGGHSLVGPGVRLALRRVTGR